MYQHKMLQQIYAPGASGGEGAALHLPKDHSLQHRLPLCLRQLPTGEPRLCDALWTPFSHLQLIFFF